MTITRRKALGAAAAATMARPPAARAQADFQPLPGATLKSDTSGEHWFSPTGIAAEEGAVPRARIARLVMRYPDRPGGALVPLQSDNAIAWPDGSLKFAAVHGRIPAGYVAGQRIGVGVSDGLAFPAAPDWRAVTGGGADAFRVVLSIHQPKVVLLHVLDPPVAGDQLAVVLGNARYARTITAAAIGAYGRMAWVAAVIDLMRDITFDPSGGYRCFDNTVGNILPAPTHGDPGATDWTFEHLYGGGNLPTHNIGLGLALRREGQYSNIVPEYWPWRSGQIGGQMLIWPRAAVGNPSDFPARFEVTRGKASAFSICTGSSDTTGSTRGTLPTMLPPAPRVTWTATWSEGTPVDNEPWFDGHQVRQETRLCPLKDPGGAIHPHLQARLTVTWNRDGTKIDRQVLVENPHLYSGAREYWYDVVAIEVAGVNQIAGELDRYRQLIHTIWAKWRWRQAKPLVLCDALAFMKARLIPTWRRDPRRDYAEAFLPYARGADRLGGDLRPHPGKLQQRGGYHKPLNQPLYAGPIAFDASGGGRVELGPSSAWGWAYWTTDQMLAWPGLEAVADNCFGAYPFYPRDEMPHAGHEGGPPHLYFKYRTNPNRSVGGKGNQIVVGVPTSSWTTSHASTGAQPITMYGGSNYGGYGFRWFPVESHAPGHPARDAYLARPEKCFLEATERYGWMLETSIPNQTAANNEANPLRTRGAPGDPGHKMAARHTNGERSFSWPWRSIVHTLSIMPDRHSRRAQWQRACDDMSAWYKENVLSSWNGFYRGREWRSSYAAPLSRSLAGDRYVGNEGQPVSNGVPFLDLQKSGYVVMVAGMAQDMKLCTTGDLIDAISRQDGFLRMVADQSPENRWALHCLTALIIGPTDDKANFQAAAPRIFATEDMSQVVANLDGKSPATLSKAQGLRNKKYVGAQPVDGYSFDFHEHGLPYNGVLYVQNYSHFAELRACQQIFARHCRDQAKRAAMTRVLAELDQLIPPGRVTGRETYAFLWGQWGWEQPGSVTTEW